MDIKLQADQTSQRCSANTYIFVLKVHNIICVVFWGLEGEEPRHHLALSTPPPLPSCPYRPINKFYFKESQTKGLWPTHLRRNKKCRFSIFHSTCTCLWVSSWATRLSTNKPISVFHSLSFKHSLGPWTNQLPKLYLCNQEWYLCFWLV